MAGYDFLDTPTIEILKLLKPSDVERMVLNFKEFEFGYRDSDAVIYYKKDSKYDQISIPLHPEYTDYPLSLSTTVKTIADNLKRPIRELLTILGLKHPSDIIYFELKGEGIESGTVPLESGANLYSGAYNTLLAAAFSTDVPGKKYYVYSRLSNSRDITKFCRIGQTNISSYSVPLICPLFVRDKKEINYLKWEDDPKQAYTRHVTINLMKTVDYITESLSQDKIKRLTNPSKDEPVISSNICDALVEMEPKKDNLTLQINPGWLLEPPEGKLQEKVIIKNEYFKDIKEISYELKPKHVIESEIRDYLGTVHLLKDNLKGIKQDGAITDGQIRISIIGPSGKLILAKMVLDREDYLKASIAHSQGKAIIVRGVLEKSQRAHEIVDIEKLEIAEILNK